MRALFLKILPCEHVGCGSISALTIAVMVGINAVLAGIAAAQMTAAQQEGPKIHIQADKVIADLASRETQFVGNVRVTQAETTITAERMTVTYEAIPSEKGPAALKDAIEKIIATGNVTIRMQNVQAFTAEATYVAKTKKVTLWGKDSKVMCGPYSIVGTKFTVWGTEGKLCVEGDAHHRVKTVIMTAKKGVF